MSMQKDQIKDRYPATKAQTYAFRTPLTPSARALM